jgi:hypothetical protein
MHDPEARVRAGVYGLLHLGLGCNELQRILMGRYVSGDWNWYDPKEPITPSRVAYVVHHLGLSVDEVRQQYELLAGKLQLELIMEWQAQS